MDAINSLLQGLETAFQKHEQEVVIELAIDRILHYFGVYMVITLVVLSKASEVIGEIDIACYVTNNTVKLDRGFMQHAKKFCWESFGSDNISNACGGQYDPQRQERLLNNAWAVKTFSQWMPYFLLIEVMLFSIPSLFWHTAVGASLTGHLKFSLSFLKEVYETLKIIPAGLYRKLPYDEEGIYLDGWRRFRPEYKSEQQQGMDQKGGGNFKKAEKKERKIFEKDPSECSLSEVIDAVSNAKLQEGDEDEIKREHEKDGRGILCGSLKDKQLFSILCYENFASLEYHPYIMSVYALTSTAAAEKDQKGVVPLKQGILRQFYNKKNFSSTFLCKCYVIRYLYNIAISSTMLVVSWILFGSLLYPSFTAKTFECEIPFHDLCMICTLKRHWDVVAMFVIDICIVLVYFLMSLYQFCFVRFGSHRAVCHYFEDMADNFSVALTSAFIAEQNRKT